MDLILAEDRPIDYVGFFVNVHDDVMVVGTNGDNFFYGPFQNPNLNYLYNYYVEPEAKDKKDFERLHEIELFDQDLVELTEVLLDNVLKTSTEKDEKYLMSWELREDSPWGSSVEFDVTSYITELKKYISESKSN